MPKLGGVVSETLTFARGVQANAGGPDGHSGYGLTDHPGSGVFSENDNLNLCVGGHPRLHLTPDGVLISARPSGRALKELQCYTAHVDIPPLSPHNYWDQAVALPRVKAGDKVLFVQPTTALLDAGIQLIPMGCVNDAVRVRFQNVTDETIQLVAKAYDVGVVEFGT